MGQSGGYMSMALERMTPKLDPAAIDACVLDITEASQSEARIRQYRRRFQSLIEEQTRSHVAQRHRAQQAAKAKSEFISNISHELRTPMHAILSYSKMGIDDCGRENPETLERRFPTKSEAPAPGCSLSLITCSTFPKWKPEKWRSGSRRAIYQGPLNIR